MSFQEFLDVVKTITPDRWGNPDITLAIGKVRSMFPNIVTKEEEQNRWIVIVESLQEAERLIPYLGNLVAIPAIVHVPSSLVAGYGRQKGRILRPYKAHNEKMGANWRLDTDNPGYRWQQEGGNHYKQSNYRELIRLANDKLKTNLPKHNYDLDPRPEQQVVVDMQKTANRELKGINQGLQEQLDRLNDQMEKEQRQQLNLQNENGKFFKTFNAAAIDMAQGIRDTVKKFQHDRIRSYAIAHVDAFHPDANGCRIPTLAAPPTATTKDYQSISFKANASSVLIVVNYMALRMAPVIVLQGDQNSELDLASTSTQTAIIQFNDSVSNSSFTRPTQVGPLNIPFKTLIDNSSVGKQMPALSEFSQLRLVAGGFRLWKTSRQENESGVVQALYGPSGLSLDASVQEEIERRNGTHHHIKVYPAALEGKCGGRAGFLLGGQYRPNDEGLYTRFSQATDLFLKIGEGNTSTEYITRTKADERIYDPNEEVGDDFFGPLRWFAGTIFMDSLASADVSNVAEASFGTRELRMPHVGLIHMQGLTAGSSYEIELTRHFEGLPTAENASREMFQASLPLEYSSPLQVLHRAELRDHIISPAEYYMQRGIYLRGLWDWPVLRDLKDVLNLGLDKIQSNPEIVKMLEDLLPKAIGTLSRQIPLTAEYASQIESGVQQALQTGLTKGYQLKGPTHEEQDDTSQVLAKPRQMPRILAYLDQLERKRNIEEECKVTELD